MFLLDTPILKKSFLWMHSFWVDMGYPKTVPPNPPTTTTTTNTTIITTLSSPWSVGRRPQIKKRRLVSPFATMASTEKVVHLVIVRQWAFFSDGFGPGTKARRPEAIFQPGPARARLFPTRPITSIFKTQFGYLKGYPKHRTGHLCCCFPALVLHTAWSN